MNAMIATITYCIVGCNTLSPDHDALKVLECDTETGAAKIVQQSAIQASVGTLTAMA